VQDGVARQAENPENPGGILFVAAVRETGRYHGGMGGVSRRHQHGFGDGHATEC
jgi:hypothetical protein